MKLEKILGVSFRVWVAKRSGFSPRVSGTRTHHYCEHISGSMSSKVFLKAKQAVMHNISSQQLVYLIELVFFIPEGDGLVFGKKHFHFSGLGYFHYLS